MDHQGNGRRPNGAGNGERKGLPPGGGDTVPFDRQRKPASVSQAPRRRRRKRIPQRIYRRGRLAAFFYVAATLAICVGIAAFFLSAFNDVLAFSKPNQAIEVEIPEDADTAEIAAILKEEGLIKYDKIFVYISKFEKVYEGKYQSGTHVLNTNMGYTTMMTNMTKQIDRRETVRVTIPEGLPMQKVAKILEDNGVCDADEFVEKANNNNFGFDFEDDIPGSSKIFYPLEGYLFPDTYEFYKDDSALNVVRKFLQNTDSKITPEVEALMRKKGLTLHETLTLASIVQAEATGDEMKRVSSVYWNRLNDKLTFPLLQADPTRDYANEQILTYLGDRDKQVADYYNTYVSAGVPPGPINNPGLEAIMAVLEPEDTPYYYFCTDTRTKEFYYAETLDEHNQNVQKAGLRGWK